MLLSCKKTSGIPYRLKELDLNIYSLEELCYFIFNFAVLISRNFINNNLLDYLDHELDMHDLVEILTNDMKENKRMETMLIDILKYSNYYSDKDIAQFIAEIEKLKKINQDEQLEKAGDTLKDLNKLERAIRAYEKIKNKPRSLIIKIANIYGRLQMFDKAILYYEQANSISSDDDVLKKIYYIYKLNNTPERFQEYADKVTLDKITDWDVEYIEFKLQADANGQINIIDEMFLMDDKYILENVNNMINKFKIEYRNGF